MPNQPVFRSFTRLVIGIMSVGYDGLYRRLQDWEEQTAHLRASVSEPVRPRSGGYTDQAELYSNEIITISEKRETDNDHLRYVLIGLAFKTQERISSSLEKLGKATRVLNNISQPIHRARIYNRILSPFHRRYNELVLRGQAEVDRLAEVGRMEDIRSRDIVNTALNERVDSAIDYLADNPGIQEIIQTQSFSLAEEIVEEARERAISADNLLEGIVRSVLRRAPRSELPPPPLEVRSKAIPAYLVRKGGQ